MKLSFRQRWHEFFEGQREIKAYYETIGEGRFKADGRYEHQLLVECYEREAPHVTRVGIELAIFLNVILFNLETFLYLMTGRMSTTWRVEIDRQLCEEADEQLLSYAY